MRQRSLLGAIFLALAGAHAERGQAEEGPTLIGVARVDITPDYPVRLSGYLARPSESAGVAQRIWAKALAIGSDTQKPAIFVAVDNLGVSREIVEAVAERLKKQAGIERARFVVGSSHTHSAPCLTNVAPNIFGKKIGDAEQASIDRYTRALTDDLERVSLAALADRQPGRLSWAQGKAGFAKNRRTPGGPVDHDMPVLRVLGFDGTLRAVVVNYACHCTTDNHADNKISGDWAGHAQASIEGDHPGVIALTVVGCGADSNPDPRNGPNDAARHGRAVGDEVNRLLGGAWVDLPGAPVCSLEQISIPFDTLPTRAELEALIKKGGPPGYNASVQLAKLDRGEALQSVLDYPIGVWSFDDRLAMVFLAGEVVVDYSLRLKRELDGKRLWITAYANDEPCYIPSERILREGGYEATGAMVYYSRPTRLKPGIEAQIIAAVHEQMPAAFRAPTTAQEGDMPPPQSPRESLRSLRLKPGFRAELVASEPLVLDPVAIDFGADGKLWVCEMRDYPMGIDGNWKTGGVIRYLEDRDGDGRYDRSTTFLEDLPFPTGVMAWRKGAIICAAPEIIYAEDTDGDGKADVRRVLFQGFATENYQARVNGLSYNLDNWVYGANGLIGGKIRGTAEGQTIDIGGRDFRMLPDTGALEPASGLTQQGRVHDDWGNQFGGNNSVLVQQYPFPDHYARRNRFVAAPAPTVIVPHGPDMNRLYPASHAMERYNHPESANRVTSACGVGIYRDTLLGAGFEENAFTCEPVHNVVHREVLKQDGVTFESYRAGDEAASEFVASTDPWFRPVQAKTGPDGALWVVDMYRFVIEHPRWISPEVLAKLDVRAGSDRGRIYRIYAESQPPRGVPKLDGLSTPELAAQLDHPNGMVRDNVQRLVVHRGDKSAAPVLEALVRESVRPVARMQALCTLDGLGALTPELVQKGLVDTDGGVRQQAVRLAERWLGKDEGIATAVVALVKDPEATVRFQLALSLGEWDDPRAATALGELARLPKADRWLTAAILSSATHQPVPILKAVLGASVVNRGMVTGLIATIAGGADPKGVAEAIAAVVQMPAGGSHEAWRFEAALQLLEADRDGAVRADVQFQAFVKRALVLALDPKAGAGLRVAAVTLLSRIPDLRQATLPVLDGLLEPKNPAPVQGAAVGALAASHDDAADAILVRHWPHLGPGLRAQALDAMLARPDSTARLLSALERKEIAAGSIDAAHRQQMLNSAVANLKERAVKLYANAGNQNRRAIVERYLTAASKPGDALKGRAIFAKTCASCHKYGGQGYEVGPDLAALTDRTPEALLVAILDPNREVDARYASYSAALNDGRVVAGLIAAETANAITLKRQEGQTDEILRANLEEIKTAGQSLMPEGFENDLKPADLADLVAYLAGETSSPKRITGNDPRTVLAGKDGSLRLSAANAEIYGPNLTFEAEFGNLGYWMSREDRAAWSLQVDRAGTYTVAMEWACADESAGNLFQIRAAGKSVTGKVGGTGAGTWSRYRSLFVGEVTLPAGPQRLEFRAGESVRGALIDLRAVVLSPRIEGK